MKQNLPSFLLVLLLTVSFSFAKAQVAGSGTATISNDLIIVLNEAAPLVADYSFDISQIKFENKEEAERFFSLCHDNLMNFSVSYESKTASVHISLEYMEPRGWGIKEYNEYFLKLSERYRQTYAVVIE